MVYTQMLCISSIGVYSYMRNISNSHCLHFEKKSMYRLSQLFLILLLYMISLYHIVMLIILLFYTAILKEIILFFNYVSLRLNYLSHTHRLKRIVRCNINDKAFVS